MKVEKRILPAAINRIKMNVFIFFCIMITQK
jgi:hypothetical protein